MHKFVRSFITEWRRLGLPFSDATVVVAVSGGADSVSLLLAMADLRDRKKLGLRFVAAHFNHGLRGKDSDADEQFAKGLAAKIGVEYVSKKGKVAKAGNLEQNARTARYDFLLKTAKKYGAFAVLTAHTVNDQAETFLMNLLRGSGPDGLAAMPPVREFEGGGVLLVRPMLRWASREATESFCADAKSEFRHDAMNEDPSFMRVRVRKELLPQLKAYNPRIVESLAKTAELLARDEPAEAAQPESLELAELAGLTRTGLYSRLREWIRHNRGNLRGVNVKHIEAIERLVHSRKSGKTVELPGSFAVVKGGGRLRITDIKVEK